MNAKTEAARAIASSPVVDPTLAGSAPSLAGGVADEDETGRRRGLGLAVFVIILVAIATITLSLLLRRPPQSGEGLSMSSPRSAPALFAADDARPDRAS
ncbi:MAG TPA: hypothetical protein VIF57_29520 [Polyangia bacterium]